MHFNADGPSTVEVCTKTKLTDEELITAIALAGGNADPNESSYKATVLARESCSADQKVEP
jgi:hypothetical protein